MPARLLSAFFSAMVIWLPPGCSPSSGNEYSIPAEFEEQEYIWLSWIEHGFLGGDPFNLTIASAIREITPYSKVRLYWASQEGADKQQAEARIITCLIGSGIDTSRVELYYGEPPYGAIQDPGPIFLRNRHGNLALADFNFRHPNGNVELIDENIARDLGLPVVSSDMISEGGAWQTNGKGTLILVESVELDRNPSMTKTEIENEYKRVLGAKKVIWLKQGLQEEEWGKLKNGVYGIGTGGHIDEFCRFADANTLLLTEVTGQEGNEITMESHRRMEENFNILRNESDQDGNPFNIIRIPSGDLMTKKVQYATLTREERSWFDDVIQDSVEFYLATGYLNFVIANGVVVTSKYWREGLPEGLKVKDDHAKAVLQNAFPDRRIVQIDCMPLHHDGAGLHCHSRNQPKAIPGNQDQP